jgi:hypothetical protein
MPTEAPQTGESRSESSETTGALSSASLEGKHQQRRHRIVHRESTNVATEVVPQDEHLKIGHETRSSKNNKQHAIRCVFVHIMVDS